MERNRRTGRGGRKHFRSNCRIPLTHRHRCGTLQQTLCSELTGRRNEANSKGACPPGPLDPPGWSKMLKCVMWRQDRTCYWQRLLQSWERRNSSHGEGRVPGEYVYHTLRLVKRQGWEGVANTPEVMRSWLGGWCVEGTWGDVKMKSRDLLR